MIEYPIKIQSSATFIAELSACEYGRYEDAQIAREENDIESIKENEYEVVLCDFIDRWKTMIEVKNDDELCELYYALASGTIGLYSCRHANTLLDKIRDDVKIVAPSLVEKWPTQNCK